jgi:uncharacterized membrane protein
MSFFKWEPLSPYDEQKVLAAIADAELNTSGEIRVHLDKWCKTDPLFKAKNLFTHLQMDATAAGNGVLIYVAVKERKFAIVGDTGIDRVVPPHFWESTKQIIQSHLSKGNLVEGLVAGISEVGLQLKQFFPYQSDDTNELPNEISYG